MREKHLVHNRIALITGASQGIGAAVAEKLAELGYTIALHYNNNHCGAQEVLRGLKTGDHTAFQADLASVTGQKSLWNRVDATFGTPHVIVHNAAIAPTENNHHPLTDSSFSEWQQQWEQFFALNLHAPSNLTHLFATRMIAENIPGRIVFIGSRGAYLGEPTHPAYGVSKASLHALAQSLAVALAPHNIAVSALAPGFIATPRIVQRQKSESITNLGPFNRMGTPEEVAAAVAYLISEEGAWAAGSILDLNGASYLR